MIFSDSSQKDYIDTERSTSRHIALNQRDTLNYGWDLTVPVTISSGEAEYISTVVIYMKTGHLRMLIYDLKIMGSMICGSDNLTHEPKRIIIDNGAAICTHLKQGTSMVFTLFL